MWVCRNDRSQLVGGFPTIERLELDPLDAAGSLELGDERQQGMAPVKLVRAVGEEQHHRRIPEIPDEEAEQVARRAVRPVEVLDDEQDRRAPGQALEHTQQELEEPALRRERIHARAGAVEPVAGGVGGRPEIGHEAGQLDASRTEERIELVPVGPSGVVFVRDSHRFAGSFAGGAPDDVC